MRRSKDQKSWTISSKKKRGREVTKNGISLVLWINHLVVIVCLPWSHTNYPSIPLLLILTWDCSPHPHVIFLIQQSSMNFGIVASNTSPNRHVFFKYSNLHKVCRGLGRDISPSGNNWIHNFRWAGKDFLARLILVDRASKSHRAEHNWTRPRDLFFSSLSWGRSSWATCIL